MSSPVSSTSSEPSVSPLSTAPSTPPLEESSAAYFVVSHVPTATFLTALPVGKGGMDRVFLLAGSGPAGPLLQQAVQVVGDKSLLATATWECVKSQDGDTEVSYIRTKNTPISDIASPPTHVDLEDLHVETCQHAYASLLNLCADAGLRVIITLSSASLSLHILERPAITFPRLSQTPQSTLNPTGHPYNMPSLAEFHDGWRTWDLITLSMLPPSLLHSKPIDLRHKPLFYMGHLPTFLNLLLSAHLAEPPVPPKGFAAIFERGIDPHVDDPEHCHAHSEVPVQDEDWPALPEVLAYRDRVRARLAALYAELAAGTRPLTRRLVRTLAMVLEHDGFHIETLLYMLIQRAGTGVLPPPGFAVPPWEHLAAQWDALPAPASPRTTLGPCTLTLGHDDAEPSDLLPDLAHAPQGHAFGWDNESPGRAEHVAPFEISWRPISNGAFFAFWDGEGRVRALPPSWVEERGEVRVRTLYGAVPMRVARHWPMLAAYDDLAAYAAARGGRIPTEAELRVFLDAYQVGYAEGANVAFRNWHPLPATAGGEQDGGRGSNGGVWEWTSTVFDTHQGFVGTTVFPGYSSDFFDTKHQVVLGASYATIPRLADRRTVRNFYQHNYPYAWVGARVAYDL